MFSKLLIANRGEIACRIIRTARAMGIATVAVYSDADAKALHVRHADEAVHIGASPARESYLVGEKIIAAAKATGAEAIHPGYGFLSENAEFAQAVIDAGLIWVGPSPASITAMGLKDAAKTLMAAAGVPVTPGYLGVNQDLDYLAEQSEMIGYPVLIKAVAGGGGKGMRLVQAAGDFADALQSCQREAASAFGNAHVLIEKYIQRPRHIEVQVFGDSHGNVVHLFERDCSLQRRHQKVIEEAPAPGMDEATRAELCAAAVKAAKAVDYVGAGTIEFIADASEGLRADRIWFMEMNTRLQVEHPVTEEITGVDLVEWQLRVAAGEALPLKQEELSINGWAMEARLYAEDPAKGFLPSTGRLEHFSLIGNRIETGVTEGDEVSPYYDPMIAKIVERGYDREDARTNLLETLRYARVAPVRSNAQFLLACVDDEAFKLGQVDTGLIARREAALTVPAELTAQELSAGAILVLESTQDSELSFPLRFANGKRAWVADESSRFSNLLGFRLNHSPERRVRILVDETPMTVNLGETGPVKAEIYDYFHDGAWSQISDGSAHKFQIDAGSRGSGHHSAHDGDILSPMPGKIIAVEVTQGQSVTKGQKLLTLEAMKMEHSLVAPFDGVVAELSAVAGAQVQVEALLARIEASAEVAA